MFFCRAVNLLALFDQVHVVQLAGAEVSICRRRLIEDAHDSHPERGCMVPHVVWW